ncbi:MAG: DUF6438 domain-containing protein [Tenacibaculum sp.]
MKYLLSLAFLLIISCFSPKKSKETKSDKPQIISDSTNFKKEKTTKGFTEHSDKELIVVLKNAKNTDTTLALLKNSNLTWEDANYSSAVNKIGIVKLPDSKQEVWIERLQQTGNFSLVVKNDKNTLKNIIADLENTLVSLRKTACFGDCPVYEVLIDKQGKLIYKGLKYVSKTGVHKFDLTETELKTLKEKLVKENFKNFKELYDNSEIMDLSSTYIVFEDKQVEIRLWKDIPDPLIEIHEFITNLLYKRKFVQ